MNKLKLTAALFILSVSPIPAQDMTQSGTPTGICNVYDLNDPPRHFGLGVLISNQETWTVWHVAKEAQRFSVSQGDELDEPTCQVQFLAPDGSYVTVLARVEAHDEFRDFARLRLLGVVDPRIVPLPIANDMPKVRDTVYYVRRNGRDRGLRNGPNMFLEAGTVLVYSESKRRWKLEANAVGGDSGGAVLHNGALVGLLTASNFVEGSDTEDLAWATPINIDPSEVTPPPVPTPQPQIAALGWNGRVVRTSGPNLSTTNLVTWPILSCQGLDGINEARLYLKYETEERILLRRWNSLQLKGIDQAMSGETYSASDLKEKRVSEHHWFLSYEVTLPSPHTPAPPLLSEWLARFAGYLDGQNNENAIASSSTGRDIQSDKKCRFILEVVPRTGNRFIVDLGHPR